MRLVGLALVVVALALFPLGAGNYPVKLLQEILIWGLFAMSLDLLMGYAGMVSFGHAAFFGIGGYVAALALVKSPGLISALLLPALAAGLAALVIGFFSIRVSGVYFIMLTLAFSQMFYAYAFQVSWLGAEDGLVGVPRPVVPGANVSSLRGFHGYLPRGGDAQRARALAHRPLALRPRAARHPRERGAHGGGGVRGGPLQAPGLRHRGRLRGPRRLALRPVQRLDRAGRRSSGRPPGRRC